MPTTPNFGWNSPTVGGSTGAWGTLLNTLFDDVDADLKAVKDTADDAAAENLAFPIMPAAIYAVPDGTNVQQVNLVRGLVAGLSLPIDSGLTGDQIFAIPILGLKAGMRITGFKSRGNSLNQTLQVSIRTINTSGANLSTTSGTLTHTNTTATLTASGLSIDVVADTAYFFNVLMSRTTTAASPSLSWVQAVVTRP